MPFGDGVVRQHAHLPGGDQLGLDLAREVDVAAVEGAHGAVDGVDRAGHASGVRQRPRELAQGMAAKSVIGEGGGGQLEVLGRGGVVGVALRRAELEQQLASLVERGRLLEGAAQVGDRVGSGAALQRRVRRPPQEPNRLGVAGGTTRAQVRRDALRVGALAGQEACRVAMSERPLLDGQLVVDRGAHDRVHEFQGAAGREDRGGGERVRRPRRRALVESCQRGRVSQLRVESEHGDGPDERVRSARQAREPQEDRPGNGRGSKPVYASGARGVGGDAIRGQDAQQLGEHERVAGRRVVAGLRERGVAGPEAPGHEGRPPRRPSAVPVAACGHVRGR